MGSIKKMGKNSSVKIFGVLLITAALIASVYYIVLPQFLSDDKNQDTNNDTTTPNEDELDDTYIGITVYGSGVFLTPENFTQGALDALLTESWYVRIYGNVRLEVYIGISYLINGNDFVYLEDKEYSILNSASSTSQKNYSGVALDDVFAKTKCLRSNSTRFYYNAEDNYRSYDCTIKLVKDNPGEFLLANEENGIPMTTQGEGGNGPIRGTAPLLPLQNDAEIIQIFNDEGDSFVYNSAYFTKYLNRVYII